MLMTISISLKSLGFVRNELYLNWKLYLAGLVSDNDLREKRVSPQGAYAQPTIAICFSKRWTFLRAVCKQTTLMERVMLRFIVHRVYMLLILSCCLCEV